jgi:hypothetical protein
LDRMFFFSPPSFIDVTITNELTDSKRRSN